MVSSIFRNITNLFGWVKTTYSISIYCNWDIHFLFLICRSTLPWRWPDTCRWNTIMFLLLLMLLFCFRLFFWRSCSRSFDLIRNFGEEIRARRLRNCWVLFRFWLIRAAVRTRGTCKTVGTWLNIIMFFRWCLLHNRCHINLPVEELVPMNVVGEADADSRIQVIND